jgi:hypothetical protein
LVEDITASAAGTPLGLSHAQSHLRGYPETGIGKRVDLLDS